MTELFDGTPMTFSLERQIEAVRREIAMRCRVYPRWIEGRKMTAGKAAEEIAVMEAVLATLEGLRK